MNNENFDNTKSTDIEITSDGSPKVNKEAISSGADEKSFKWPKIKLPPIKVNAGGCVNGRCSEEDVKNAEKLMKGSLEEKTHSFDKMANMAKEMKEMKEMSNIDRFRE
ncbi:hypothetical protein [Priestia megaterium]